MAISPIDDDVSTAASDSASVFSSTCFTLRTICSIELDTSLTLPDSTIAVSLSSSPAAPSSRIELLDSSTDTLSRCELSAIPRTCRLISSIDVVVCWIPRTWSAVTDETASDTPAISPAVASTRSAASDTRATVARSELPIASNERDSSPSSSSDSYTSPRRRSPDDSRSASPRSASVARLTSCASSHASSPPLRPSIATTAARRRSRGRTGRAAGARRARARSGSAGRAEPATETTCAERSRAVSPLVSPSAMARAKLATTSSSSLPPSALGRRRGEIDDPDFDRKRELLRRRARAELSAAGPPSGAPASRRARAASSTPDLPADREIAQRARRLGVGQQHREDHRQDRHAAHRHQQLRPQRDAGRPASGARRDRESGPPAHCGPARS